MLDVKLLVLTQLYIIIIWSEEPKKYLSLYKTANVLNNLITENSLSI